MQLQEFLIQRGERQEDFARRADISQCTVSRVCSGYDCRGQTWAKIMHATGGAVTPLAHFPSRGRRPARRKMHFSMRRQSKKLNRRNA